MKTLYVPSLTRAGKMIEMRNIGLQEAIAQIHLVNVSLVMSSDVTLKDFNTGGPVVRDDVLTNIEQYTKYSLIENLDEYIDIEYNDPGMIDYEFKFLVYSDIYQYRGLRAVYIDLESDSILVGATVVYNPRHAAVNVFDPSIASNLLEMV